MAFSDLMVDRIKLKNSLRTWRILAIISLIMLFLILISNNINTGVVYNVANYKSKDFVARINIDGIILSDSYRESVLSDIAKNDKIKAVILHLDSPGGTIVGGEQLYNSLKQISTKKPLFAVMGNQATSGGYMAAIAANKIFAHHGTITGSIGVIFQSLQAKELLNKIGVDAVTIKSSPIKANPNLFEENDKQAVAYIQETINSGYKFFTSLVKKERKQIPAEKFEIVTNGRIFSGTEALEYGLIDAIGGEQEALKMLTDKPYNLPKTLPIKDVSLEEKKSGGLSNFGAIFFNKIFGYNPKDIMSQYNGLLLM